MPTYEYICRSCGHLFEIVQSMRDDSLTECPECGGELRKVFAPPAISFKGSGFYATDQRKKATTSSGDKGDKGDEGEKGEKGEKGDKRQESGRGLRYGRRQEGSEERRSAAAAKKEVTTTSSSGSSGSGSSGSSSKRRGRLVTTAEIGVFGGSGFYSFLDDTETVEVDTPYGSPTRAGHDR